MNCCQKSLCALHGSCLCLTAKRSLQPCETPALLLPLKDSFPLPLHCFASSFFPLHKPMHLITQVGPSYKVLVSGRCAQMLPPCSPEWRSVLPPWKAERDPKCRI